MLKHSWNRLLAISKPRLASLAVTLLSCGILIAASSGATASNKLSCTPTSPMFDDVGSHGYSFRAHSNLAKTPGGEQCMQWIIRNDPGRTAVRVEWYYPQPSGNTPIIGSAIVSGCHDTSMCDCKSVPCQVHAETSPLYSAPQPKETTAEYGVTKGGSGWSVDSDVRARILPRLATQPLTPKPRPPARQPAKTSDFLRRASAIFSAPVDWRYPDITTHIGGFPSTPGGAAISLDLTLVSSAKRETERQYNVSYNILGTAGANEVYLTSEAGIRSGRLSLNKNAVAVAWTAVESLEEPVLFDEPLSMFRIQELAKRAQQPRKATRVGITDETRLLVYYGGAIILDMPAPSYIPIEFD